MRIAWVTRSFLDYRIPVFRELDRLAEGRLYLVFSKDYVPATVADKACRLLGDRAVAMSGEWRVGPEDSEFMANRNLSLRFQPGVCRMIRRIAPDVVIGDGFFKWTLPALWHRIRSGTPLVICYERWEHTERFAQWYRKQYRKAVIRYTDAMCCNGLLSKQYTAKLGMAAARITLGHMAADTQELADKSRSMSAAEKRELRDKYRTDGIVYLYAGRLIPRKGLDRLIGAWAVFEKQSASGTLLIAGGGAQEAALKKMITVKGIRRVRFAGTIPYDSLAYIYAASDIFVIPTLEDNWSLVVPEAMACGLPILCSKYNGCWPELIRDGENGWVFDPLDCDDTVRALCAARDAGDSLQKMANRSLEIVEDHSPRVAAEAILEACRIAVDRRQHV